MLHQHDVTRQNKNIKKQKINRHILKEKIHRSLQGDRTTGALCHPPMYMLCPPSCFMTKLGLGTYFVAVVSLEETLKHGSGVCGAGLLVLNGFLEVLNPITALPDFLKLPGQDLCAPLPG